jgi:hypothetical protein
VVVSFVAAVVYVVPENSQLLWLFVTKLGAF